MSSIRADLKNAARDFSKGIEKSALWRVLGWNDVQTRYNRSKLGPFWASLSVLIFVSALGPIYSSLFDLDWRDYTLHLVLGLIVWNYISAVVLESGKEYVNSSHYIVSFQLSYFTLILRVMWRNLIVFSYQMLVFAGFAIFLKHTPDVSWLVLPFALLLITLNVLWMGVVVSVVATRFRDFAELLNNILRLVFFATPIMWVPSMRANLEAVTLYNPFYHLIELLRGPLHHGVISVQSWCICVVIMLVGWGVAFVLFARFRSRIAFWV